jgi:DNA-binding FadR family transcriptional regulator
LANSSDTKRVTVESDSDIRAALATAASPAFANDSTFKRNIHGYLVHKLGSEIVAGFYPPGSLLPNEADICARFGVSRTTLREAYSVLAAKSLIVARPKIGTRVRPKSDWKMLDPDVLTWHLEAVPTAEFVSELYTVRQMVEPEAAALAASTREPERIERIRIACEEMAKASEGEGDLIKADLEFHLAILGAARNRFIDALSGLIHTALQATFKLSWWGAARIRDDRLDQHHDVYIAIRDHKPDLARQRMRTLLRDSLNDVAEFLRHREEGMRKASGKRSASGKARKTARAGG